MAESREEPLIVSFREEDWHVAIGLQSVTLRSVKGRKKVILRSANQAANAMRVLKSEITRWMEAGHFETVEVDGVTLIALPGRTRWGSIPVMVHTNSSVEASPSESVPLARRDFWGRGRLLDDAIAVTPPEVLTPSEPSNRSGDWWDDDIWDDSPPTPAPAA